MNVAALRLDCAVILGKASLGDGPATRVRRLTRTHSVGFLHRSRIRLCMIPPLGIARATAERQHFSAMRGLWEPSGAAVVRE